MINIDENSAKQNHLIFKRNKYDCMGAHIVPREALVKL